MVKRIVIVGIILVIGSGLFFIIKKNNENVNKLSSKYYNKGDFIDVTSNDLKSLNKDTYLLFVYNNYCAFKIPCDKVFKEFMEQYKIDIVSIPFDEFKNTLFYQDVLYAPSILIIKENKVIAYLDANSDNDINKYQDSKEFANWVKKYISLTK